MGLRVGGDRAGVGVRVVAARLVSMLADLLGAAVGERAAGGEVRGGAWGRAGRPGGAGGAGWVP
ncbi:hypothetical protein DEGR_08170 [Deinococcus grandis]|nr:hypothetical protein DEGR_08170 [Deinococcus grandis]